MAEIEWNDDWHNQCPHCSSEDDIEWVSHGMPIDYWEGICGDCGTTWTYEEAIVNVKITVPKEE
tara:strand:- start:822 stop:1013 length:192 start_codon:yes stop_codon:yes gene_type:complete